MIIFSFEILSRFENLDAACSRIFDGGNCKFRFYVLRSNDTGLIKQHKVFRL